MRKHPSRHHIFSIYADPHDADTPIEAVANRFSVWAFLFHGFWLFYHRAYFTGLIWFAIYGLGAAMLDFAGVNNTIISIAQVGLQLWIGFEGHNLREYELTRKGLAFEGAYVAHDTYDAELQYLETHPRYRQHPA